MRINTIFILIIVVFAAIFNIEAKFTKASSNNKNALSNNLNTISSNEGQTNFVQKAKLQTYKSRKNKARSTTNCPAAANGSGATTMYQGRNIARKN